MYGDIKASNMPHTQHLPPPSAGFALCITGFAPHVGLSNAPTRWWEKLAMDDALQRRVCLRQNWTVFINTSPTKKRRCVRFQLRYL